ncbi:phenylalanine transporter [Candidatus Micrarchaeum sp.]|jgi:APA family basic amino acid/polyamine antiporter|uniref:APC family permease n=1 Tax=Candidatus Micrarchaeum sp. TaxID=2282148 RepID=UPI0009261BA3|nr:amino acid permease [Candidatus Micrarchaeum sp.]OJI06750.1 MAG: amino acid permease [Candidatus Micrarchaeum sp. ARMAN-1]OWP53449.1 MAG: amino acid permease [Thermoplasmatales archaeon ARMAN]QRF73789.1 phenylalanine transporter [Candidatus Micrarchaeum sp.]
MNTLSRSVTLTQALMINLGAIIGAGIFVIIGVAIGHAGPSIIISIILSAIIAILTGLSFAEIARHVAKEGGVYEYAKESFRPFAGFIGGWLWTFGNIIAIAAVSISMGGYVNILFSTHINTVYFAIAAIIAFSVINILGIKNSAKTISAFVVINLAVLLIFIVSGLSSFHLSNFSNFAPNGMTGTIAGAAIIFFAFTGFSRVTTISDEVKDPEKTIPKAIILSIIISTVIYIAVAIVAVGLVPYSNLASSAAPLSTAIKSMHDSILAIIIAFGGVTATAGVILTGVLGTSRVFFALGRDKELPGFLSYIDRFSTPINAIIVSAVLSIIFLLLVSFGTIVDSSNAAVLSAYFIINVSAIYFYYNLKKKQQQEKRYIPVVSIAGIFGILLIVAYLDIVSLEFLFGIAAVGTIYYVLRNAPIGELKDWRRHIHVPRRSAVRAFGPSRQEVSTAIQQPQQQQKP